MNIIVKKACSGNYTGRWFANGYQSIYFGQNQYEVWQTIKKPITAQWW